MRAVEVPLGFVDIGDDQRGTQVLQIQPVRSELRGIRLNPDGGLLAAANTHQSNAGQLRDARREPGIGEILYLRKRNFLRKSAPA